MSKELMNIMNFPINDNVDYEKFTFFDKSHLLWSALNMLEIVSCIVHNDGDLIWTDKSRHKYFQPMEFPDTLDELGYMLGIIDLQKKLASCHNIHGVKILSPENAAYELIEECETGNLTIRRKNCSCYCDGDSPEDQTIAMVKKAINENRFHIFKQPIVYSHNNKIKCYECLIRIIDENGTVIMPIEFVAAAEKCSIISKLDFIALELAIEEIKQDPTLHLAVNVSGATIEDTKARVKYENLLKKNKEFLSNIIVEITETIALEDLSNAARFVHNVKSLGCSVALDDFGAGSTSFRALKVLPIDEVKIDGVFVQYMSTLEHYREFIQNVVTIAKTHGIKIVAERVESEEEAETLKMLGIDFLQGYLFGTPKP